MFSSSTSTPTDASAVELGQVPPNSAEGHLANVKAARRSRIANTLLQSLSSQDVFFFLASEVPAIHSFEAVWSFTGADLVSIEPKNFVRVLQTEFPTFPFSAGVEVYKLVQQKIITDVSISEGQPSNLSTEVVQSWSENPVPSFQQALSNAPNFSNQVPFAPDFAAMARMFPNFARDWQASPSFPNQIPSAVNFPMQIQGAANFPNQIQGFPNFPNQTQGVSNFTNQIQGVHNFPNQFEP